MLSNQELIKALKPTGAMLRRPVALGPVEKPLKLRAGCHQALHITPAASSSCAVSNSGRPMMPL